MSKYKISCLVNHYFHSCIILESLSISIFWKFVLAYQKFDIVLSFCIIDSQLYLTNVHAPEEVISNSVCDLLPDYTDLSSVKYQTLRWRESMPFSPYAKREVNPSIYNRESATSSSSVRMLRNYLIVNERYSPLITSRIMYVPLIAFLRTAWHGYRKYIEERSRMSKILKLVNFHQKR